MVEVDHHVLAQDIVLGGCIGHGFGLIDLRVAVGIGSPYRLLPLGAPLPKGERRHPFVPTAAEKKDDSKPLQISPISVHRLLVLEVPPSGHKFYRLVLILTRFGTASVHILRRKEPGLRTSAMIFLSSVGLC